MFTIRKEKIEGTKNVFCNPCFRSMMYVGIFNPYRVENSPGNHHTSAVGDTYFF
eukprot:m.633082 g.633082  ORF g.633082 m.633082 type:complete len:54 (-) comp22580_c0_seq19:44-205(-)